MTQDKNKYVSIGATVLFTGLLAAGSGGYAFYTVFKVVELSVGLGALWGAMILNIDRLMILGMATEITPEIDPEAEKKSLSPGIKKLLKAIPRAVLAVGIGIVLSTPVTLRLFQKEIAHQISIENKDKLYILQTGNDKNFGSELDRRQKAVDTLNSKIEQAQTDEKNADEVLQKEIDGTGGSGRKGKGTSYEEKSDSLKKRRDEVTALQKQLVDANTKLNETLQSQKEQLAIDKQKLEDEAESLGRQLSALHHLGEKDPTIHQTESGLQLLFILIETMPLIMKLMSGESAHDKITSKKKLGTIDMENQEIQQKKSRVVELANVRFLWSSTSIQQIKQNILKFQERAYRCRQKAIELDNLDEIEKQLKYAVRLELMAKSLVDQLQAQTPTVKTVQNSQRQYFPNAAPINS